MEPRSPLDRASPVCAADAPSLSPARGTLGGVPWLRAVPAPTLDRLAAQAVLHRVPAGSVLFDQAELPSFAQLLIGGQVELLGVQGTNEMLVELAQPTDLLLPAAVLTRQPYLLRARVRQEAHLLLIQADPFRQAVSTDQALSLAVLACLTAQFRRQVKQAKNIRLRSAEERVGCYLLSLFRDAAPGATLRLSLEKRLIASQLGMTRETLSRALSSMARHGIRVAGGMVALEDEAAARARFPLDPLIDGPETIVPLSPGNR